MNKQTIISTIVEAALFIAIIVSIFSHFNKRLNISEHNYNTLKGEMEQVELKNGELLSMRDSYIVKLNELNELLDISKAEVKELNKALD